MTHAVRIAAAVLFLAAAAAAGEPAWKAMARDCGLTEPQIARLEADGILATAQEWSQMFTPYLEESPVPFVTSDSLLAGFHRVLEKSLEAAEYLNASRLPRLLRSLLAGVAAAPPPVPVAPDLLAAARRRAAIVVAVPLALLGREPGGLDPDLARTVREEVARVREAAEALKPAWLGPPDPGFLSLDYGRFRPRGFYAASETLSALFSATAFLESIPFRLDVDVEVLTVLLLAGALDPAFDPLFTWMSDLAAAGDEGSLPDVRRHLRAAPPEVRADLARLRAFLAERIAADGLVARVNDGRALAGPGPAYRVLSPRRVPDALFFAATGDGRRSPNGLLLAAGLGSAWAEARLPEHERARLPEARAALEGSGLWHEYLRCVALLLAPPPEGAPPFMVGEAWQRKSAGAALAGWAQLRHAFVLHAKEDVVLEGIEKERPRPWFVEHNPAFFAAVAGLAARARGVFEAARGDDATTVAAFLREYLAGGRDLDWGWTARLAVSLAKENGLAGADPKGLRDLARRLEDGEARAVLPVERSAWFAERFHRLWKPLENLAGQLRDAAELQARGGTPETPSGDAGWYGKALAEVMGYDDDGYVAPADDAPVIADIHFDPNAGRILHVGIGRPRALYVIVPDSGGPILTRGAVFPFYEATSAARLTDEEWRALLDGPARPRLPPWLAPLFGE